MFPIKVLSSTSQAEEFPKTTLVPEPVNDFMNQDVKIESFIGKRKLILFESKDLMERALDTIDPQNVNYRFRFLPAIIASEEVDATNLEGVKSAIASSPIFSARQTADPWENAINLRNEVAFNTLEETKDWVSIEPLWERGLLGQNQSIAIIDSGINRTLAFFDIHNLTKNRGEYYSIGSLDNGPESTFDFSGHGTHVAGIAVGNGMYNLNGRYRLYKSHGMAPEANFKSIRVLNEFGSGENLDVLAGIDFAISLNVSVISLSLGSDSYNGTGDLFVQLMQKVAEHDILAVIAAGNLGNLGGSTIGIPGALDTVLSVGAIEDPNTVWDRTSRGPSIPPSFMNKPDVLAPGVNIISVHATDGSPSRQSGTSMAVPHVSGGSLLLRQAFPNASAIDIRQAILASAKDLKEEVEIQGRGLVNFTKAYEILENKFNGSSQAIQQSASVNPIAIHDGQEFNEFGVPVRQSSNSYFRSSIINETRNFNVTIFTNTNLTLIPRVAIKFGSVQFGLPDSIKLTEGTNRLPLNVTVTSSAVEFVKATIYFLEAQTLKVMQFTNISFFALSRFQKGRILFDASKDADTPGDYFLNDRPEGKFSALSVLLRNKGFILEFTNKSLTPEILEKYDVLVIPDPELPYSGDEILSIRNFVDKMGGGLLVLGSGGTYVTEAGPMNSFSIDSLNAMFRLDNGDGEINIRFDASNSGNSSVDSVSFGLTNRIQPIVPQLVPIPFYGPYLTITNDGAIPLASYANRPILAADEVGSGRVIVSSSVIPFSYQTLKSNQFGSMETNEKIVINLFEWLIESRGARTKIVLDEKEIGLDKTANVRLYDEVSVSFTKPTLPNGTEIPLPSSIKAYLVHYDAPIFIAEINFTLIDRIYVANLGLFFFGSYELNIPILSDFIHSSVSIEIFAFLENYENQKYHDTVAISFLWLLFFSWLLWLRNEGGRDLKRKLKSK